MKKLDVRFTRQPADELRVGTLAEERGRVYFEYASEFIELGLELSPFRLPLQSGLIEHRDHQFGPLPGLFDDSLPDGWGLLLMDRYFRKSGYDPATISPLDRLCWLGTRTMGALTYHPPAARDEVDGSIFDLHELSQHAREVYSGAAVDVRPQLLRAGGSPGGARPKVLVGYDSQSGELRSGEDDLPDGYEHWILKFHAHQDEPETGAIEYAYALMAKAAGINIPPTRLFETPQGDRFFGVKRFDRDANRRYHVHTFGNLIQANFRIPSADYADLLKATSLLTRDQRCVQRVFQQMVFNVLTHNRDDHVKNFAFLLDDTSNEWTLSPAYDLVHTSGPGGEHSMTLLGEGQNPQRSHLLQLAQQASISKSQARTLIESVQNAIRRWDEFAEQAGVPNATAERIARAFWRID